MSDDLVQRLRLADPYDDQNLKWLHEEAADHIEALKADIESLARCHARQFDEDSKRIEALEAALRDISAVSSGKIHNTTALLVLCEINHLARRALEGKS